MPDIIKENVKSLIKSCENELNYLGHGVGAVSNYSRYPRCPLVNIIWDGVPEQGTQEIHDVFDETWSIALSDDIAYTTGNNDSEELNIQIRNKSIPLKMSTSIPDTGEVNIVHYLNVLSDEYEKQVDSIAEAIKSIDTSFFGSVFCFLCVICDDYEFSKSKIIRERILYTDKALKEANNVCAIYLGNQLANGKLLKTDQQFENYRVAATAVMLCSTRAIDGVPGNLTGWFMQDGTKAYTASYYLLRKPSDTIALITLKAILERRIAQAAQNRKKLEAANAMDSGAQFMLSAGAHGNTLSCLDDAFERYVTERLPKESAFEFLPNWKKAQKNSNYQEANSITEGFLDVFVDRYFTSAGKNLDGIDVQAICSSFILDLSTKFDYAFAKDYFKHCSEYLKVLTPGKGSDIYSVAVNKAKSAFYDAMKPHLKAAMVKYSENAALFSDTINSFSNMLGTSGNTEFGAGLVPVEEFYSKKANNILDGAGEEILTVIQPTESVETLCDLILKAYKELTQRDFNTYHTSLEEEIQQRVIKGAAGAGTVIHTTLVKPELEKAMRMKATAYLEPKSFFIIYGDAVFANGLPQTSEKFYIKDCDRAEKLILKAFDTDLLL